MAKITFDGLDEYRAKLLDLGTNIESVCKRAVYPAAAVVIEAIKANTPVWVDGVSAGDLRDSAKLMNFENSDGFVHTAVYFVGYDKRGVPNPVKARVLESGSSTRQKHPFIRPAVNRVKLAAEAMIAAEFDKICDEKMNS